MSFNAENSEFFDFLYLIIWKVTVIENGKKIYV